MSNTLVQEQLLLLLGKINQTVKLIFVGKSRQDPKKKLEIGYLFELKTNTNLSRFLNNNNTTPVYYLN